MQERIDAEMRANEAQRTEVTAGGEKEVVQDLIVIETTYYNWLVAQAEELLKLKGITETDPAQMEFAGAIMETGKHDDV